MSVARSSILSLDVGDKRIGLAVASYNARLPRPLLTLERDHKWFQKLQAVVEAEGVTVLVIGWPRGLQGQHTAQTRATETFQEELRRQLALPIYLQDEALSSQRAETELTARGQAYSRGDIDALAATYILEDFLNEHRDLNEAKV